MKADISQDGIMVGVTVLAEVIDMTAQGVYALEKSGTIPERVDGKFDLIKSVHGYCKSLKKRRTKERDATEEKTRLLKEQADAKAMENAEKRGELVRREKYEEIVNRAASVVVAGLDSLPLNVKKACPELPARSIEVIRLEIAKMRNVIADTEIDETDVA